MSNEALAEALKATARTLEPFTLDIAPGSRVWDGGKYAASGVRAADPQARMWFGVLNAIAAMLEGQGVPVTARQLAYLRRELFGGMGSLLDFSIDESRYGESGRAANRALAEEADKLSRLLQSLGSMK